MTSLSDMVESQYDNEAKEHQRAGIRKAIHRQWGECLANRLIIGTIGGWLLSPVGFDKSVDILHRYPCLDPEINVNGPTPRAR